MEFQQKASYLTALKEMNNRKPVIPVHTPIRISSPARRMLQNARTKLLKGTMLTEAPALVPFDSGVVQHNAVPGNKETGWSSPMKGLMSSLPVNTSTPNDGKAIVKINQAGLATPEQSFLMESEVYSPDVDTVATPLLRLPVQRRRSFNAVQMLLLPRNGERGNNGSVGKSVSGSNLVSSSFSLHEQSCRHDTPHVGDSMKKLLPSSPLGKLILPISPKTCRLGAKTRCFNENKSRNQIIANNGTLRQLETIPAQIISETRNSFQSPTVDYKKKYNATRLGFTALDNCKKASEVDVFEGFQPAVLSPLMPAVLLAGRKGAGITDHRSAQKTIQDVYEGNHFGVQKGSPPPEGKVVGCTPPVSLKGRRICGQSTCINRRISSQTPRGFTRRALVEHFV